MMRILFILGLIFTITLSCGKSKRVENFSELDVKARTLFAALPAVAENPENPLTDKKVDLGKMLYFDKRLSKDNTQSCNTCHNLDTYGVDNNPFSKGNDGELGGRNSPTTLNAALHIAQFWDGREPDVEAQAGGPILNPVEMAMPSEKAVVERLSKIDVYVKLFAEAFPEQPVVSYDNLKKAIGAFERKLITPTKFDEYLSGKDDALTDQEKHGLKTYIDAGCTTCHSGSLLGGSMYQKFGLFADYWTYTQSKKVDQGRFDVTKNEADKYIFKVSSLRNIEKTGPYFHDGSVGDLKEAVSIMAKIQVNKDLTEKEINDIVLFLKTLTGNIPQELKRVNG
jgi:cytochrome c peroxidase